MSIIGDIWELIVLQPLTNIMVVLAHFLFNNFGLSIIILTILINVAMYPLTLRQMKSSKAMQDLQPKIAEIQRKHGKDKAVMQQETMKLYRESGVNPAGCLTSMFLPMPIWIALYQTIRRVMALTPESFLGLSTVLYSWAVPFVAIPINNKFLWLNLGTPDAFLAVLVGLSLWLQQKMVAQKGATPQAAQQAQMMQVMMPVLFAFFSFTVPSGLALYWVVNSVIRIVIQYFFSGWGGLAALPQTLKTFWPLSENSMWRRPRQQTQGRKK